MAQSSPGYGSGFARSASQSAAPEQWYGELGCWAPFLGNQGATLYDVSGYQHHGTLNTFTLSSAWNQTSRGMGLQFDGSSDYVSLPPEVSVKGLSAASISVWYLPLASPGGDGGLYAESTNTSGFSRWTLMHR